jgi:hypothetical protein
LTFQAKRLWTVLGPPVAVSVGANTGRRQLGPRVYFADAKPKGSQDLCCVAWLGQFKPNLPGRLLLAALKVTVWMPCHSI